MDNCIDSPSGKPQSYFDSWLNHRLSDTLYIEVMSGALKGTFGRYLGIDFGTKSVLNVHRAWNNFYQDPSEKKWEIFRAQVAREDIRPKLSIVVSDDPWETTRVSMYNCNWEFTAKPLGKVSAPRIKKEIKEEDLPDVYDHLGEKIKIGDFCSYILYHHRYGGAQIYYGTVTKITPSGNVYCTDINVGDWPDSYARSEEKKVLNPSMITILNDTLMDRIMIARLSS